MVIVWRILATIAAVNMFTLAVFVGLATVQYNSILSDLTRDRLVVLADTVRRPFQSVADLGVPIGTVRNADAVLERVRSSDDAIVAIHILSPEGEIIRSTATQMPSAFLTGVLAASRDAGPAATWHVETKERFLVGANIAAPTGLEAGGVLMEYSKSGANLQLQAMEARLILLASVVLGATSLVGLCILRIVLSEHLRIFGGILSSFDSFERKFWRGTSSAPEAEVEAEIVGLGLRTSDFRALLVESENQYQRVKHEAAATAQ